jgi:hypothetical protein
MEVLSASANDGSANYRLGPAEKNPERTCSQAECTSQAERTCPETKRAGTPSIRTRTHGSADSHAADPCGEHGATAGRVEAWHAFR